MSNSGYPYRETLLQWIWQELEFDTTSLRTSTGEPVEIIEPGTINHGAGPDFLNAEVRIGPLKFFGDVEIHINPKHWAQHNHSGSADFNGVVLHVVYDCKDDGHQHAYRPDGTTPPLLELKPYLEKSLAHLFERKRRSGLPCSGNVNFINQNAFEAQIEKAHRNYFEFKTDQLLSYYDGSLSLTKAWLGLFTSGLFYTLGIPRNQQQMLNFHTRLKHPDVETSLETFIKHATDTAFNQPKSTNIEWVSSGMRPASSPSNRVQQAAAIYYAIYSTPFKTFLTASDDVWPRILKEMPEHLRPGKQVATMLKQTIYYPAIYLLGEFLHAKKVKSYAYSGWLNARGGVPGEVSKPFKASGFSINSSTRKPGLAHQLKRYCRPRNCHRCEVFKKAINP
jgi:hypothetical protein